MTNRGIPFAYQADGEAPGRWGVELLSRHNRYILRPMEALQVIPLGSVEPQPIELGDALDHQFKPGLFCQCEAFLNNHPAQMTHLCIRAAEAFPTYYRIAGYAMS